MRKLSAENHHCNINHKVTLVRLILLEIRIFNLTLCTAVCQAAKYAYITIGFVGNLPSYLLTFDASVKSASTVIRMSFNCILL